MDDAHGFGVLEASRGTADHWNDDQVDVLCGSFSKSLAGAGGFIASPSHRLHESFQANDLLTALSPLPAHAQTALEVMQEEPGHHQRTKEFGTLPSHSYGLELDMGAKPLPSPRFGRKEESTFWKALLEKAFIRLSRSLRRPPGKDLIRTAISAAHTDEDLDRSKSLDLR